MLSTLYWIQELIRQIIFLLTIITLILAAAHRVGLIQRALQRLAEHLLSKDINGALVTIANIEINLVKCHVQVIDLIIHNPQREEWQWDSPLLARIGKIDCTLNILSCIEPISSILNIPCKDIYSIRVEDVQIFVEKRQNVFNFHLLDDSLDIPDPQLVMSSLLFEKGHSMEAKNKPTKEEISSIVNNKSDNTNINSSNNGGRKEEKPIVTVTSSFETESSISKTDISPPQSSIGISDLSVEKRANDIVRSMLGAVSSLGKAVNEGGKEGFEKALEIHKVGFVEKLKKIQESTERPGGIFTSSRRRKYEHFSTKKSKSESMETLAKKSVQVMKQMGKAVEKNVSQIQQHLDYFKKPPPKKKGWVKKVNNDIFRIGYIMLSDARIFIKDLVVGTKTSQGELSVASNYTASLRLNDKETQSSSQQKQENSKSSITNNDRQFNTQGWSPPIWLKSVTLSSADLCPALSSKNDEGIPFIGLTIDELLDVITNRLLAEVATTNSGEVFRIAMGDVFNWIDLKKQNSA